MQLLLLSCLPGRRRRRFDSNKLDRNLKMATSRLGIVANKYYSSTKLVTTRRAIETELLQTRSSSSSTSVVDGTSSSRLQLYCESLIRDEHYYTVMDLLMSLCQGLVGQRLHETTTRRPPPHHLLTTISTILYAASRLPVDIPELMVVRQQLRAKYGTKFVKEAEQNVNQTARSEIVTKLEVCHYQVPKEMIDARVLEVVRRRHSTISSSKMTSSRGRTIEESKDRTVSSSRGRGSATRASATRGSATRVDIIENESAYDHHARPPPMNPAYQSENKKKNFSEPTTPSSPSKANHRQPLSPLFCNNNNNNNQPSAQPSCIPVKPSKGRRPIQVVGMMVDENDDLSFMSPTLPIYIFRPNPHLEIAFDVRTKNPVYTLERLVVLSSTTNNNLNHPTRTNNNEGQRRRRASFFEEVGLPPEYRSKLAHYRNSGYDRGHMAPAADFGSAGDDTTFTMTNVCPQVHSMNNSIWKRLEHWCRRVANNHDDMTTLVVTGPLWLPSSSSDEGDDAKENWQYNFPAIGETNGETTPVHVPTHFFKVVVVVLDESSNTNTAKEICKFACFLVPNAEPPLKHKNNNKKSSAIVDHVVHWKTLETLSGLQFFPNLTTAAQWKEKAHRATNQVLLGQQQQHDDGGLQHLCAAR